MTSKLKPPKHSNRLKSRYKEKVKDGKLFSRRIREQYLRKSEDEDELSVEDTIKVSTVHFIKIVEVIKFIIN